MLFCPFYRWGKRLRKIKFPQVTCLVHSVWTPAWRQAHCTILSPISGSPPHLAALFPSTRCSQFTKYGYLVCMKSLSNECLNYAFQGMSWADMISYWKGKLLTWPYDCLVIGVCESVSHELSKTKSVHWEPCASELRATEGIALCDGSPSKTSLSALSTL